MGGSQPTNTSIVLSAALRQLNCWRGRQRNRRARLSDGPWQKAVALARKHGLNKTVRVGSEVLLA